MRLDLTAHGPTEADDAVVQSELFEWVQSDKPHGVEVSRKLLPPAMEDMGAAEYVEAVTASTPAIAALLFTVRTWLKSRTGSVSVQVVNESGRQVTVDATNVDDVDALVEKLTAAE